MDEPIWMNKRRNRRHETNIQLSFTVEDAVFRPNHVSVRKHLLVVGELQADGEGHFGSRQSGRIVGDVKNDSAPYRRRTGNASVSSSFKGPVRSVRHLSRSLCIEGLRPSRPDTSWSSMMDNGRGDFWALTERNHIERRIITT